MCGIAVHFSPTGTATPFDLGLIRHRGPDSSGDWTSPDGHCWLGNTRLAIVDLSQTGAQPMTDPDTGNVIVANGEIYNHRALRSRLYGKVNWQGTSDTETILKGYARWGQDVVKHLGGMFAFAIYDPSRKELFVARDRLGIKPLYYKVDEHGFQAASEVRVLIAGESNESTGSSLSGYLQWGACPEGNLLYPTIHVVPAGHTVTIGAQGDVNSRRYWPGPAFSSTTDNIVQRLRGRIDESR